MNAFSSESAPSIAPSSRDSPRWARWPISVRFGKTRKASYGPRASFIILNEWLEAKDKALKLLRDDFATKPQIKNLLRIPVVDDDEGGRKLIDEIIARNPDRKVRAEACKGLIASIGADEEKQTRSDSFAKGTMPWIRWWSGRDGIVQDWEVKAFPTIDVLDARGVVHHTDPRGEEREEAVNALLEEAAPKAAG